MTAGPVSAIVVSYHTGDVLDRCLDSLFAQPDIGEVILVDNGNPPEILSELQRRSEETDRLRVLTGHGNIGFAAACNLGAAKAESAQLLFLNPDAALPEGGLATLRSELQRVAPGKVAMIGGRLIGPDGREQAGGRRDDLTPSKAIAEMLRLDRVRPGHGRFNWHEDDVPTETVRVPTISGACMLLARADYKRVGGMDERYFLHVEDVDFCRRFRTAGGEIYFCPSVDVAHEGGSSREDLSTVHRRKAVSMTRYFGKHFGRHEPVSAAVATALVWSGTGVRMAKAALKRGRQQE